MSAPSATSELAVVTGGGSGIGRATALRLARRGLHTIVTGRTAETLHATVAELEAAGGTGEAVVLDVGAPEAPATLAGAVGERPVRALVHNAGLHVHQSFADTTRADLEAQLAVNLVGPFMLTQALLGRFADGAGIVFVSSITATRARDLHIAYAAAKAGLIGLTAHLAAELAPTVRVNCVSPGATDTAMLADYVAHSTQGMGEDEQRRVRIADRARLLLRRIATPDEVAATIEHLALDATAVTGVDVSVDVGYRAT